MKATGIIVEYNPFHNGHKYHLEKTRDIGTGDVVIAVMSGDYVQRGEPSIIDRWTKTEIALKNGVDIVVELPVFYSSQSAEIFAKGAIGILNELRCEDIVFGSESADTEKLQKIAQQQESLEFKLKLKERLKEGYSYPTAHSMTMKSILNEDELNSNDILGLEYIKAIRYWNSKILPKTLKREKVGYHDKNIIENFASATKIREKIKKYEEIINLVPKESSNILMEYKNFTGIESFYPLIRYECIKNRDFLDKIQDMEIGFQNKLYESAIKNEDYINFFQSVSNKRYTTGRVQRVFIHSFLGLTQELTELAKKEVPYVRILGFNSRGQKYLSYLKQFENRKIITSYKKMNEIFNKNQCKLIEFNEKASTLYRLINPYKDKKLPLILKEENYE